MTVSGYFFRAFFTLLLTVSFSENATASGFDLTPEELAFIEQEQRAQEEREMHAAMAASRSEYAAKKQYDESRQIEKAVAADLYAQRLKQEAEDYERALALSRETHPAPYSPPSSAYSPSRSAFAHGHHHQSPSAAEETYARQNAHSDGESDDEELAAALELSMQRNVPAEAAVAVAAPELSAAAEAPVAATAQNLSERARMAQERARSYQSAPPVALSIDEQVESTFEREKREIENKIRDLESLKLGQRYGSNERRSTDARLNKLTINLQDYLIPSKITATKLRLKSYISSQEGKY